MTRLLAAAAAVLAVLAPPAAAAARLHQLVVFRDGKARVSQPSMAQATVKVAGRRCAVGASTPLAALVHSGIGPLSLHDFGACSKNPADGGSLFVRAIGPDRNRGSDGWVYKAGNVLGTAGAADPSGPFGRGRLRSGAHVTWFWCHVSARDNGCPHTLVATARGGKSSLTMTVRQYDDHGKGRLAAGATVHAGDATATTGTDGNAHLTGLVARRYTLFAEQPGRIRSFPVTAEVR